MVECTTCESILSGNTPGWKCLILRDRKYLIGILIGAVLVWIGMKIGKGKKHD